MAPGRGIIDGWCTGLLVVWLYGLVVWLFWLFWLFGYRMAVWAGLGPKMQRRGAKGVQEQNYK